MAAKVTRAIKGNLQKHQARNIRSKRKVVPFDAQTNYDDKGMVKRFHHQCRHLQAYLDEFNYRFNRLKHPKTIFHNLIVRMMEHPPTIYQKLKLT